MNLKNFAISTLVGGFVYWLTGWLFYGILFKSSFPHGDTMNMTYIVCGCLFAGMLLAFIFNKIGGMSSMNDAMMNGGAIGAIGAISHTFFENAHQMEPMNMTTSGLDIAISIVMGAIAAIAIWFVHSKMNTSNP